MPDQLQPSFARGELTPSAHGRVDTAMYGIAVKTARNAIVHSEGGISNRPGLEWVGPVKDHTYDPRLIPFRFKADDQYVLEFGDEYMRVIREGGYVLSDDEVSISSISKTDPVVVTVSGHSFDVGDDVFITGVDGMFELNNRWFSVSAKTSNTISLQLQYAATDVDATSYGAYKEGGTVSSIYELVTPYDKDDLSEIKYVQLADVITLTHKDYPPQELSRTASNSWTIEEVSTIPSNTSPSNLQVTTESDGLQYIRNGTFSSTSNWSFGGGWSLGSDVAEHTATGSSSTLSQSVIHGDITGLSQGTQYTLSYTLVVTAGTITPKVGGTDGEARTVSGTYQETIQAGSDDKIKFIADTTFAGSVTDVSVVVGADTDIKYQVTALEQDTLLESLPGSEAETFNVTSITQASPAVVEFDSVHTLEAGQEIVISGVTGMTEINNKRFLVQNPDTTTIELEDSDSSEYTAYIGNGSVNRVFVSVVSVENNFTNTLTWDAVSDASHYVVYKNENGLYGYIGETTETTFEDENITPDFSQTPPQFRLPFDVAGDYPGTVSYFEQRRVFGGSTNKPDTSFYSVIGAPSNFSTSSPNKADDAITATLNALEINEIRHYIPGNDLIVLTAGSEWRIDSGGEASFEVATLRQKPQSRIGVDHVRPIVIGNTIVFLEERRNKVRSLGYSFQNDSYQTTDLSVLATHLLMNHTITSWDYSHSPFSIIHMVRDDGKSLALTFNEEHEVVAWTVWETQGEFKDVVVSRTLGNDSHDEAYFVVKRTIGGSTVRYVEKTWSRLFTEPEEGFFVDGGVNTALSACTLRAPGESVYNSTGTHAAITAGVGALDYDDMSVTGQVTDVSDMAYNGVDTLVAVGSRSQIGTQNGYWAHGVSVDGKYWGINPDTNLWTYDGGFREWTKIVYAPDLGIWVAAFLPASGDSALMTSTDGITWTENTNQVTSSAEIDIPNVPWAFSLEYSPENGFIYWGSEDEIWTSTDGITWSLTSHSMGSCMRLLWVPKFGLYLAAVRDRTVGNPYDPSIWTSPDGINWTDRGDPIGAFYYLDFAYSPSLGLAVACGWVRGTGVGGGNGNLQSCFAYSSDGKTWTISNALDNTGTSEEQSYTAVAWCEDIGKFIAVANDLNHEGSTDAVIATSSDALDWTEYSSINGVTTDGGDSIRLRGIEVFNLTCPSALNPEAKELIIVYGNVGDPSVLPPLIMTSTDGLNWEAQTPRE